MRFRGFIVSICNFPSFHLSTGRFSCCIFFPFHFRVFGSDICCPLLSPFALFIFVFHPFLFLSQSLSFSHSTAYVFVCVWIFFLSWQNVVAVCHAHMRSFICSFCVFFFPRSIPIVVKWNRKIQPRDSTIFNQMVPKFVCLIDFKHMCVTVRECHFHPITYSPSINITHIDVIQLLLYENYSFVFLCLSIRFSFWYRSVLLKITCFSSLSVVCCCCCCYFG